MFLKDLVLVNNLSLNEEKKDLDTKIQYKVLARKYRPRTFEDLIGQDSMVKILSNAFSLNRIAHAFLFTGVRGVGKTTAARIVSRGLNCIKNDTPTISPCGECNSCISAKNDRHVDIIEIDAASHTGVDDIRELTEGVRYKPVEGRYKIYIIDEVHMLSAQAFNALLKTLEEPPEHVKFIFCTTEIRKIPVTVLSRCQKFDLRRVAVSELIKFLKLICKKEKVSIDTNSLNLLARYSDGSVRDSLSLLDQAISMNNGEINEGTIKAMLGLSDKSVVWDLFDKLLQGDILSVMNFYDDLLNSGSDPVLIVEELLEISHSVARAKAVPSLNTSQVMSEFESKRALESAKLTNIPAIARCWQLLLKGNEEMQKSFSVKEACEMILIRITYAADLPDLKTLIEKSDLKKKVNSDKPKEMRDIEVKDKIIDKQLDYEKLKDKTLDKELKDNKIGSLDVNKMFGTFDELLNYVKDKKAMSLYTFLVDQVKIVDYKPLNIKLSFVNKKKLDLLAKIRKELSDLTSNKWIIQVLEDDADNFSVTEKNNLEEKKLIENVKQDRLVKSFLNEFPEAEILEVNKEAYKDKKDM